MGFLPALGARSRPCLTAATLLQGVHLAQVSFVVRAFGSAFTLDLELNQ